MPLVAMPNVGIASLSGGAGRVPALDPAVLRGVRGAGRGARRPDHRWLLRDDAGTDRGDPRGVRHRPSTAPDHRARGLGSARARRCRADGRDGAGQGLPRGTLGRQRRARSTEGRLARRARGRDPSTRGLREGRVRRRQRQPDGAGAHERADDVRSPAARDGRRDDPPRDTQGCHRDGTRRTAARCARRGGTQHPRGDGRPTQRGGLSRVARGLRARLDRRRRGRVGAQPRRGLHGQDARRARPRSSAASPSTRPRTTSTSRPSASDGRSRRARGSR